MCRSAERFTRANEFFLYVPTAYTTYCHACIEGVVHNTHNLRTNGTQSHYIYTCDVHLYTTKRTSAWTISRCNVNSPQIFSGASNSNKIGCDRNISRDFRQRFRMSTSLSCTFFPGLAPRTSSSFDIIRSISTTSAIFFFFSFVRLLCVFVSISYGNFHDLFFLM